MMQGMDRDFLDYGLGLLKEKIMEYTSVTNPVWANAENNVINCIVDFVDVGTVPFSANPLDTSNPSSITIYDQCVAGDYGPIAVYVPPPPYVPTASDNKATAQGILSSTDWTTIADVANPINSPYLTNQAAFLAYRNTIRGIAVNPTAGNLTWPTQPTDTWSTV